MPGKGERHRLILCNDGGTLLGPTEEAPMGADGLAQLTIEPLVDTMIDTLYWQLGTDPFMSAPQHRFSDIYSHRTEVAPIWGAEADTFTTSGNWRIFENTRKLMEEGTDPPAVVIDRGKKARLEVFLSMRVNDIHDGLDKDEPPRFLSPTKAAHPEWLLGPVDNPFHDERITGFSRYSYNFGLRDVRDYKLTIATEAIQNYDLDGLDWDFCRFPRFFAMGEAENNAGLMTDLVRSLRKALDAKSEHIGRRLLMSVRVPPTFDLAMRFGLDVRSWLDEGLIDILVAGVVHGSMFRVPVEEYVEAAHDTSTQVIAQNLGLFWHGRPQSASVIWGEPSLYTEEMCRASASTYWRAGVDGIYLWNNHLIPFNRSLAYSRRPWKEIADPEGMSRRNKHYLVDHPHQLEVMKNELGSYTVPPGPLPINLGGPGEQATVRVDISDDLEGAKADGMLDGARLRLMIVHLTAQDDIDISLNGQALDMSTVDRRLLYNDCWLDFDVTNDSLQQGWNEVKVAVNRRNPHLSASLVLDSVEVFVDYAGSDVSS